MAEGLESGAPVIPTHAALTYAAEGHGAGGEMNNGVVDAAAAKMTVIQDPSLGFFIFTEEIQCQRMRMFLHTADRPIHKISRGSLGSRNLPAKIIFNTAAVAGA